MQRHVLKWYKTTYVLLVFTNFLYSYTWSSWAKSQRRQIYQNNNLIYDSLLPLMAMRHETYNTLLHCSIYKSGDTFLDTSLDWVARGFYHCQKYEIWYLLTMGRKIIPQQCQKKWVSLRHVAGGPWIAGKWLCFGFVYFCWVWAFFETIIQPLSRDWFL